MRYFFTKSFLVFGLVIAHFAFSLESGVAKGAYIPTELKHIVEDKNSYVGRRVGTKGFLLLDRSVKLSASISDYLGFSESNLLLQGLAAEDYQHLSGCFVYVAGELSPGKYDSSHVVIADVVKIVRTGEAYISARQELSGDESLKCEMQVIVDMMSAK